MATLLKQSTAFTFRIGPFVDSTDGVTAETGLTIAQADIQISKDGGAFAQTSASPTTTHDADGWYQCPLTATDTGTLGPLTVQVTVAGALPVWRDFLVVPANVYDSLVDGTDSLEVDAVAISGDTTAADNLEAMFDGTGYVDDTAPSSRAQVAGIGAASGGALAYEAAEDNTAGAIIGGITFVGSQTGTYTNTEVEDGVYHQITHATNDFDIVYGFNVGGARTAVEVTWKGYLSGSNDAAIMQVYDHVGAGWDTIAAITGQAGTDNATVVASLLSKHTGTGSELGNVYIRIDGQGDDSAPVLYTDLLNVSAVNIGQSVGYSLGSIWLDTVNGTAGTEAFVNGVADNPVDSIANVLTLSTATGLKRLQCANGTSITLAAALENWIVDGHEWTLALGGQAVTSSMFIDANVTGVGTGTGSEWEDCIFGAVTLPSFQGYKCGIGDASGTLTLAAAGAYRLIDCFSDVAGSGSPVIDCTAAAGNITLELRRWSGGVTLNGLKSGDVVTIGGSDMGTITLNGADAEVEVRGIFKAVTNNLTGSPSVTASGVKGTDVADILVDTGATLPGLLGTPAADVSADIAAVKAVTDAGATAAALATVDGIVDAIKAVTDLIPDEGAMTSIAQQSLLVTIAGYLDTEIAAIKAKTDNLPADPATETTLAVIDALIDAIKAKTDSLTFTKAGEVDANAQSINGTAVLGDGSTTPWGP